MDLQELLNVHSLEPELVREISESEILEFKKGEIILKEQQFVKVIPLVISGSIRLRKMDETGREIVLYHIEPGESCILSITSCLNQKESSAEAIVEENTVLVAIPAERIRNWMDTYPGWRKFVSGLYYERLTELMTLIDQVTFKSVDQRLMKYLFEHSQNNVLEITHQKLANEIGTAREVISRLLKQLERDNLIRLERGKIIIL